MRTECKNKLKVKNDIEQGIDAKLYRHFSRDTTGFVRHIVSVEHHQVMRMGVIGFGTKDVNNGNSEE